MCLEVTQSTQSHSLKPKHKPNRAGHKGYICGPHAAWHTGSAWHHSAACIRQVFVTGCHQLVRLSLCFTTAQLDFTSLRTPHGVLYQRQVQSGLVTLVHHCCGEAALTEPIQTTQPTPPPPNKGRNNKQRRSVRGWHPGHYSLAKVLDYIRVHPLLHPSTGATGQH